MAELDKATAMQYGSNVYTAAQQTYSKLRNCVRLEEMKGVKRFFDIIKPTAAVKLDTRYGDTPLIETEFARRAIHAADFGWGDMIDWKDNRKLFIDPTSDIVKAGAMSLARKMDEYIIEHGFKGVAYEGTDGLDVVAFPDSQVIPVTFGGTGSSNTGLTIEKILEARSRFGRADVDISMPDNKVYMAVTQRQIDDLALSVGKELANADYSALQALVRGETDTFLGVTFVQLEMLPATALASGRSRMCACWCKSGIIFAEPNAINMTVNTRPDKQNNWQAFASMSIGCTRMEDVKVQQIYCYEAV
jgi:hypothetical protein